MAYDLRFITKALYALKPRFGKPVNIVWLVSSTTNKETGEKAVVQDSLLVNRAIVLPHSSERKFIYDLVYIASNKNFTYGGLFDKRLVHIYIDKKDLPTDFEIKQGKHHFIIEGKRYDTRIVEDFGPALDVTAEQATTVDLENDIKINLFADIFFSQTVEVEVA